MKCAYLFLFIFLLVACASASPTSVDKPTTTPTSSFVPTTPPDEVFVDAIYYRMDVDDSIPELGRQATISLYQNQPTALFPDNAGLVLIYEVPAVLGSQEETTKAAVLLIGTAVGVAKEQGVILNGIEVIFYTNNTEPFIGFRAEPPWTAENILMTPLASQLIEKFEQKPDVATVTPTPTATPEGMQS